MNVSQVTLTVVEHEGRRWIVGADGSIVAEAKVAIGPCDADSALASVGRAIESERRHAEFLGGLEAERSKRRRWHEAMMQAVAIANNGRYRSDDAQNAWSRRVDASATSCYLMVKRGSNLKERTGRDQRPHTWERMLDVAYDRSVVWLDDAWGTYANNLASNLRKRFRNKPTLEARPSGDGRHDQKEDGAGDPRSPRLQMLLDWA